MDICTEALVIARKVGRTGRITLNRPKALNALNLAMIDSIAQALQDWRDDPSVHAVVLEAAGGRAFCAGGDVRVLRDFSLAGRHAEVEAFFTREYALNRAIARYPKPYVSLIDGICMGGGIGLSVHGSIRVTSAEAVFAMPETQVGLFPDVGATYILPRLRGAYGMYMALTSARAGGLDAAWLGLATHLVPRARIGSLADEIAESGVAVLAGAAVPAPDGDFAKLDVSCFTEPSVPAILQSLEKIGTAWSHETLATLRTVSPSSLLWTFEIVRRGAMRSLEQCLQAELSLTRYATRHPDFLEGVRAMVVDKDRTPQWFPARLEDVDSRLIAAALG